MKRTQEPRHPRHPLWDAALVAALVAGLAAAPGCGGKAVTQPVVNGRTVVPIDPNRPGDTLFASGLDIYRRAFTEQKAATTARLAGDTVTAAAQDALAVTDYGAARAKFDQLDQDPTLCPAPSIRCDNAAYLGGRCSYEIGIILPDQPSLADAQARLDAMLAAYPGSAFDDAADYFDGRARFELTRRFKVGSYADAEPFFERAYAANPAGTFADNAVYYDGRTEYEIGYALINVAVVPPPGSPDYLSARAWFDQAIAVLAAFPSRFPTSTYVDNAAYYLGRAWYEKPTPGPIPDAERIANLGTSISILTSVIGMTTPFVPGATYWRGRGHYDFSFQRTVAADATADLDAALVDFHAVPATSAWQPHALEWAVKSWIAKGTAFKPNACAEYGAMATAYPLPNVYTANAQAALDAWLAANTLTCP